MNTKIPETIETATFGLGCFWSPDAQFGIIEGVVRTRVGYAGGTALLSLWCKIDQPIQLE
jgi:peptide-methionine (S)-S-oxide reductase